MSDWVSAEGFLDGYVPQKRRKSKPSSDDQSSTATLDIDNEQAEDRYGITVPVLKCPRLVSRGGKEDACGSMEIILYSTKPWEGNRRKKYYKCLCCGQRFRVTEINKD